MLTPVDANGEPNIDNLKHLVALFVEQQVGGLYILGSTGQGPLFTERQRRMIAETVVEVNSERLLIIVHVGANTTAESVRLAEHAAAIGADAVSSVGPIYYPQTADMVFEHYRAIAGATQLPFFAYHFGMASSLKISVGEFCNRLLKIPHIAGIKYTSPDLFALGLIHQRCGQRLQIFSGADELMCQAALSGAAGAIGSYFNLWAPECTGALQALQEGAFEQARRFMLTFQSVIAETVDSIWSFLRAAMRVKYDIDVGPTKAPLGNSDQQWPETEVRQLLERIQRVAIR